MADPKKPTARAKSAKTSKTTKTTPKTTRRTTATPKPTMRAPKPAPEVLEDNDLLDNQDEQFDRPVAIRGIDDFIEDDDADGADDAHDSAVATVSPPWGAPLDDASGSPAMPAGAEDLGESGDRSNAELLAGVAALVLAASTFLPWYQGGNLNTISGFASGTWGPLVAFLGVAGFLIVLLRRLNVAVSLPLETGIILEGIGWISVGGVMLKRVFPLKIGSIALSLSQPYFAVFNGLMVSLMCAVALAILAGRVSTGSPFVLRPNWFAGTAGKIGSVILAVALIGGISAGFVSGDSTETAAPAEPKTKMYTGKIPKCLSDIPIPKAAKVIGGSEQFRDGTRFYCQGTFTFGSSVAKAEAAFLALWKDDGILFRRAEQKIPGASLILMWKPCGLLNITRPNKKKPASVGITLIPDKGCVYAPGGPRPPQ